MGQNWTMANNPANALSQYDDVINNYGRTPAAVYSMLGKADLLYGQRRMNEALEVYKKCLESGPPKIILPFVLTGLGSVQEDVKDYPGAIETYKRFTDEFPDHYMSPKIYESLARVYEISLNPDAAREIYEKIITQYPSTFWAEKARQRYVIAAAVPKRTVHSARPAGSSAQSRPIRLTYNPCFGKVSGLRL